LEEQVSATTLELPVEGRLPSLDGAIDWLNTEPLSPASLRGRPVVVEFWTFTCINWLRTLPYVRGWFEKYRDDGLVVIGVHTPEFEVEHSVANVRRAADEMRIEFPIAVDSNYEIWSAFANRYWPALYFADANGQIRHHRFGEGEYEYSEIVIQQLLADAGAGDARRELGVPDGTGAEAPPDWEDLQSPESYVGYERASAFVSPGGVSRDRGQEYTIPEVLRLNRWGLDGDWTVGRQTAALNTPGGRIVLRFHARDVHLVMGPAPDGRPVRFRVLLDGEPPGADHGEDIDEQGEGTITEPRLYQLIRQRGPITERIFEIAYPEPGARAYVFTFG
jgi:thiol-disulfide isomerase/thioredoxin